MERLAAEHPGLRSRGAVGTRIARVLVGMLLLWQAGNAQAETRGQEINLGISEQRITIEAQEVVANVILRALSEELGFTFETRVNDEMSGVVSVDWSGSLEQIVSWLLVGQNYVLVFGNQSETKEGSSNPVDRLIVLGFPTRETETLERGLRNLERGLRTLRNDQMEQTDSSMAATEGKSFSELLQSPLLPYLYGAAENSSATEPTPKSEAPDAEVTPQPDLPSLSQQDALLRLTQTARRDLQNLVGALTEACAQLENCGKPQRGP